VGPDKVFIEMFLAFPFLDEMEYPGSVNISSQFIPDASTLLPDGRDNLLNFTNKIAVPFRHNGTPGINKYHADSTI
jgi:hypothetical protein